MDGPTYTARNEAPGGEPILHAYPDPKTKGAPFTIGLGHTGPDVKEDTVWSKDQCLHAFYNDYMVAQAQARHLVGGTPWLAMSDARRAVVTDMAFNLGGHGLAMFQHMLDALHLQKWDEAAGQILASQYAADVPHRAHTNAAVMQTGEWPDEAVG